MRVSRRPLSAVLSLVVGASLLAGACGLAANDVAATYQDREISTETVDALASDDVMAQLIGYSIGDGDAVVEGSNARTVLDFLLEGEALIDAAEDTGARIDGDEALLEQTLAELAQQGFSFGVDNLSVQAREFLARFVQADQVIARAQAPGSDPFGTPTEDDLRFVYEQTAESGRWDRTCVTAVASVVEDTDLLAEALSEGLELADVADVAPQAQVAIDPSIACVTEADFAQLPPELTEEIRSAPDGVLVGPLVLDSGGGQEIVVFLEVDSRQTVDFEAAREELEAEVAQSILAVRIARESTVNPRYGDGPVLVGATSQSGAPSLVARVERPQAPDVVPESGIQVP